MHPKKLLYISTLILLSAVISAGDESLGHSTIEWKTVPQTYDFSLLCPLDSLRWERFLRQYGAEYASARRDYLARVLEGSTPVQGNIARSGVVVDEGYREVWQKFFPSCGVGQPGLAIRFTKDIVPGQGEAYEMFVKNQGTNEVIGLAFNSNGEELLEVPKQIAFDKDGNKNIKRTLKRYGFRINEGEVIQSRQGCFGCHPQVSLDYGISDPFNFWNNVVPRDFVEKEFIVRDWSDLWDSELVPLIELVRQYTESKEAFISTIAEAFPSSRVKSIGETSVSVRLSDRGDALEFYKLSRQQRYCTIASASAPFPQASFMRGKILSEVVSSLHKSGFELIEKKWIPSQYLEQHLYRAPNTLHSDVRLLELRDFQKSQNFRVSWANGIECVFPKD